MTIYTYNKNLKIVLTYPHTQTTICLKSYNFDLNLNETKFIFVLYHKTRLSQNDHERNVITIFNKHNLIITIKGKLNKNKRNNKVYIYIYIYNIY